MGDRVSKSTGNSSVKEIENEIPVVRRSGGDEPSTPTLHLDRVSAESATKCTPEGPESVREVDRETKEVVSLVGSRTMIKGVTPESDHIKVDKVSHHAK